ncbi:MAG: DUF4142 domain-containing protein [Chthoniobacterales bacterium]
MKKYIQYTSAVAIAAIVATALGFASSAKAASESKMKSESKLSANDKKFLKKAYKGGLEEVDNAKVAKEKAKDQATKDVAERMITDHSKANEELMNIAKEENFDLSKVHPTPMNISGNNFNKDYLTMLKKDHEQDIAMFEKEASDVKPGEDRDVPKFARKTLPTLKEHLQMVEDSLAKEK